MFDLGWTEMVVIAIVLIVVVGPKDLPRMLRAFGQTTSKLRSMAGDFRKQFDEALKEAELDDVKTMVNDVRRMNPTSDLKKALSPMEKAAQDVRAGLDSAMKPKPASTASTPATPAASTPQPAAPLKTGATAMPGEAKAATAKPAAQVNGTAAKPAAKPAKVTKAATTPAKATAKPTSPKPAAARKPAAKAPAKPAAASTSKGKTQ